MDIEPEPVVPDTPIEPETPTDDPGMDEVKTESGVSSDGANEVHVLITAKWKKQKYELLLPLHTTIRDIKGILFARTNVQPARQKIVGLKYGSSFPPDDISLKDLDLSATSKPRLMMIGNPDTDMHVDLMEGAGDDVVNDLDWDYNEMDGDHDPRFQPQYIKKMQKYSDRLRINLINPPRPGKKLLVLDLDYTLFDMKSQAANFELLKRPFTDLFLAEAYKNYELVIWSQTSWKWLEIKLTELGILTNVNYRILFVLDKS